MCPELVLCAPELVEGHPADLDKLNPHSAPRRLATRLVSWVAISTTSLLEVAGAAGLGPGWRRTLR
jgi:hypothetical protein